MYQALFTPYNVNWLPAAKVEYPLVVTIMLEIADVLRHRLTIADTLPPASDWRVNAVLLVVVFE
jgi:hypothetical protein